VGRIKEDCIRRVQDANDIVSVVESYNIPLRRSGSNFVALCPFHEEKTPSFNVNPRYQAFRCFGCGVKGGVFQFVQMMERVEFPEAVELLASRAGLEVEREDGGRHEEDTGRSRRKQLRWINSKALLYFEQMYREEREGKAARDYLHERGFDDTVIETWRLGWAPERWDGMVGFLGKEAGIHREAALDAAVEAGVLRRNDDGHVYDAFRGRVMFPILDAQHRPIGFGGRVLEEKPEAGGKYINSPEGPLFEKRKLLYGLNFAAKQIGIEREAVIVEGYTDTIMCHQYGLRNVVATLGTSLTREHVLHLRRYVQNEGRVIALFDADEAGEKATLRALELFFEEDVPLAIVRDLDVKDACEYLPQADAENFAEKMRRAQDAFRFLLHKFLGAENTRSVDGRAGAVQRIMDYVNRSPNAVKREMMRQEVAAAAGVPEESLPRPAKREAAREEHRNDRRGLQDRNERETASANTETPPRTKRKYAEERLLRYIIDQKKWADQAAPLLQDENSLLNKDTGRFADRVKQAWDRGERPDIESILQTFGGEGSDSIRSVLGFSEGEPSLSEQEFRDLLVALRHARLEEEKNEITRKLTDRTFSDKEEEDHAALRLVEIEREFRGLTAENASPSP
jgi:DNA primase